MKKILGLGLATLLMLSAAPAMAADLIAYDPPAPVYTAPAAPAVADVVIDNSYDWAGFYVGATAAHGWGTSDHDGVNRFDAAGYLVGGTVGYNFQLDNAVIGIEGDLSWSDIDGAKAGESSRVEWVGTARARAGYAFGNILPFATVGVALADIRSTGAAYDVTERQLGLAAGAGVEVGVTENISLKAEYQFLGFPGDRIVHNDSAAVKSDLYNHAVKVGVNFGF